MAGLNWTDQAVNDLIGIADFIAKDSKKFAKITVSKIRTSAKQLVSFPLSGRVVPEINVIEIREIIIGNYRLIYSRSAISSRGAKSSLKENTLFRGRLRRTQRSATKSPAELDTFFIKQILLPRDDSPSERLGGMLNKLPFTQRILSNKII